MEKTNTKTNDTLGTIPKSTPSDVTGTDKPSDSKTASAAPSGAAPSGGSPSSQPSSLSNPSNTGQTGATAPTPGSSNPGSSNAGNDGTGNGSNNVGGSKNGTGVVADAGGLPNQKLFSPVPARGALIRGGESLAAQATDSTSTGASGKHAPTAAGATAVGGGGVSAGGLGATGGGEGKTDATGSSQAGGGTAASSGGGGGGGGSSGGGGDEVLSPFGKPLSDPKFSLAGSDTDASVKKMLGNFDGDTAGDPNRALASDGEINDGVGDRESADLFDRVHAYHERCQQKGCVSGLMKRKVGGA